MLNEQQLAQKRKATKTKQSMNAFLPLMNANKCKKIKELIVENFLLLHQVNKGAFGDIYLSYDFRSGTEVAIKKEVKIIGKPPQLTNEAKVYQTLLNIKANDISGKELLVQDKIVGFPKFYGMGSLDDSYYLIVEYLGPNLLTLLSYCEYPKFTMGTACLIALQIIYRIEYCHKRYYLHRDIKPENFVIGLEESSNIIYLVDYGLSKRFKNAKNHQHIPYKEGRALVGTARYVSINTHLGIEQSRRDDLESVGYLLIFFLKGGLPWQGLKNEGNRYKRIMEKKLQFPTEILCSGLPDEMTHYMNYVRSLRFEDRPDYDYIRGLFAALLNSCINLYHFTIDMVKFDWCYKDPKKTIWLLYKKNTMNEVNLCRAETTPYQKQRDYLSDKANDDYQSKSHKKMQNYNSLNSNAKAIDDSNGLEPSNVAIKETNSIEDDSSQSSESSGSVATVKEEFDGVAKEAIQRYSEKAIGIEDLITNFGSEKIDKYLNNTLGFKAATMTKPKTTKEEVEALVDSPECKWTQNAKDSKLSSFNKANTQYNSKKFNEKDNNKGNYQSKGNSSGNSINNEHNDTGKFNTNTISDIQSLEQRAKCLNNEYLTMESIHDNTSKLHQGRITPGQD